MAAAAVVAVAAARTVEENAQDGAPATPDAAAGPPNHVARAVRTGSCEGLSASPPVFLWKYQRRVEEFYQHVHVQITVAVLICANFFTNVVQAQIDPKQALFPDVFIRFELFYNIIFALELVVNMYGTWCFRFWRSGWNRFDVFVVSIGLLDTCGVDFGPFTMLRMMRAFRVFRLFKRIKSLNRIVTSMLRAVPGVVNAFIIMTLIMMIYAILATEQFKEVGRQCHAPEKQNSPYAGTFTSGRAICMGKEYFGRFTSSLYTLFQVLTGDSWSEAIFRPLFKESEEVLPMTLFTGFFCVSFILLNAIVLINVVVAVLLEKIVGGEEDTDMSSENIAAMEANRVVSNLADEALPTSPQEASSSWGGSESTPRQRLREEIATLDRDFSQLQSELQSVRGEVLTVINDLPRLDTYHSDIQALTEHVDSVIATLQDMSRKKRKL